MREVEFKPFAKAIKSRVAFVMMAHLAVDSIDPDLPTSLSKKAYDLLIDELRYTGLIITDDMEMKAISDRYSYEEAAVMAIGAGADIVEYRTMETAKRALEGLKEAKKNQDIKNQQIAKKVNKVLEVKKSYFSEYKPIYIPEISKKVKAPSNQVLIREIEEKISQS